MLPAIDYNLDQELKLDFCYEDGSPSLHEIKILCNEIKRRKAKDIFEFGTFNGQTSYNFSLNAKDAQVFTLDLNRGQKPNLYCDQFNEHYINLRKGVDCNKIQRLYGDSAYFNISQYLKLFDFIFIDACHNYEYVLNDSLKAIQMLKSNGVIFWHDYSEKYWPGVFNALNNLQKHSDMFADLVLIKGTSLAMLSV